MHSQVPDVSQWNCRDSVITEFILIDIRYCMTDYDDIYFRLWRQVGLDIVMCCKKTPKFV